MQRPDWCSWKNRLVLHTEMCGEAHLLHHREVLLPYWHPSITHVCMLERIDNRMPRIQVSLNFDEYASCFIVCKPTLRAHATVAGGRGEHQGIHSAELIETFGENVFRSEFGARAL